MMDHLSLYKGFGSFLILAFTSSSARCSTTRVILAMIFSLSLQRLSCSRKSYHWWQVGMSGWRQSVKVRPADQTLIRSRYQQREDALHEQAHDQSRSEERRV